MAPFFRWGSTASKLEPLWRNSLLFTSKFPEATGTHFIDLERKAESTLNHPMALDTGPRDRESRALTTRPLLHITFSNPIFILFID